MRRERALGEETDPASDQAKTRFPAMPGPGAIEKDKGLGAVRFRFKVEDRIAEVDTILTTLVDWPGRPESQDPSWSTAIFGEQVLAQRLLI